MTQTKNKVKTFKVLATVITCLLICSTAYADVIITGVTPIPGTAVPWLTSLEDAIGALSETTTITVAGDETRIVNLTWQLKESVPAERGTPRHVYQTWAPWTYGTHYFVGTFELPDGVLQSDPPTPLEIETTIFLNTRPRINDFELTALNPYRDVLEKKYPWYLEHLKFDQPGKYVSAQILDGELAHNYHYYVPISYDGSKPMPIVFDNHGGGSYGLSQAGMSRFDRVAEREGFFVVWLDRVAGRETTNTIISDIIDELSKDYNIDLRRIYSCGISAGGGTAIFHAYDLPDKIGAIAPVAAGTSVSMLPKPTTVILFPGTQDHSGWFPRNDEQIAWIVEQNQCDLEPTIKEWYPTTDDPTGVTRYIYSGGVYGTEVIVYKIHEGGHTWPGGYQYAFFHGIGYTTQHIIGAEVMWDHFKNHTTPMPLSIDINPKAINPRSQSVITVAVDRAPDVDPEAIEIESLRFGPNQAQPVRHWLDGKGTMRLQFRTQDTGIQAGDTSAELTGRSMTTGAFHGTGAFRTVPR